MENLIKFGEFKMVAGYFVSQAIQSLDIGHITCCSGRDYLVKGIFISSIILKDIYLQIDELCEM